MQLGLQPGVLFGGLDDQGARLPADLLGLALGGIGGRDGGLQVMGAFGHLMGGLRGLLGSGGQVADFAAHALDLDLDIQEAQLDGPQEAVQGGFRSAARAQGEVERVGRVGQPGQDGAAVRLQLPGLPQQGHGADGSQAQGGDGGPGRDRPEKQAQEGQGDPGPGGDLEQGGNDDMALVGHSRLPFKMIEKGSWVA